MAAPARPRLSLTPRGLALKDPLARPIRAGVTSLTRAPALWSPFFTLALACSGDPFEASSDALPTGADASVRFVGAPVAGDPGTASSGNGGAPSEPPSTAGSAGDGEPGDAPGGEPKPPDSPGLEPPIPEVGHCDELPEGSEPQDVELRLPGGDTLRASCDTSTAGGGWLLVLSYVHAGGTSPPPKPRTDSLPRWKAATLGDDESGTESWGHAAPALFARLPGTELRFDAVTSGHERRLHFSTGSCLSYFATGWGSCEGIQGGAALDGHDAALPGATNNLSQDRGDFAMTDFPFFSGRHAHWGIAGSGDRWEVDDFLLGHAEGANAFHTIHRVWLR